MLAAMNAIETFIHAARAGLAQQTAAHGATWHLGEEANWSADLDAGSIAFDFADGTVATAAIQVVGTYNQADGSFLWGWDHPSVPEALRAHAQLAREWGEQQGAADFTARKRLCSEDDAWSFAAVANRLAEANGVYRGTAGSTLIFMTFGPVQLQKPGATAP
jgi:L-rhamnose isomerase